MIIFAVAETDAGRNDYDVQTLTKILREDLLEICRAFAATKPIRDTGLDISDSTPGASLHIPIKELNAPAFLKFFPD